MKTLLLALAVAASFAVNAQSPTVFAAASLKNALDEVAALQSSPPVISYGSSSTLARQIENGAPADVFISADLDWMDYVESKGRVEPGTRRNLLGNQLVLVAPKRQPVELKPAPGFPIYSFLKDGRLALADPNSVPAGKYAKAALEKLGVWSQVSGRIAGAENVRAALALVARGEAPLGVVYQTDAKAEPGVMVAGVFPPGTYPPIVYPVAVLKGARPGAAAFAAFLSSREARRVFEKHGFAVN